MRFHGKSPEAARSTESSSLMSSNRLHRSRLGEEASIAESVSRRIVWMILLVMCGSITASMRAQNMTAGEMPSRLAQLSQPASDLRVQQTDVIGNGSEKGKRAFAANERMSVAVPKDSVLLAQPLQIAITLSEADVSLLTVRQYDEHSEFDNESAGRDVGSGNAKIVRDDGLTKIVEVVPLQVGAVNVDFDALFSDGGMSHKAYTLNVAPSSDGLKSFYLNRGFHSLPLVLEDKEEDRQLLLSPEVYYKQLDYPIYLRDCEQVKLTVQQSEDARVIQLDRNGLIHALSPGTAKIIGDFAGMEDSVVVHVYTKESAPLGYRHVPITH